jgi:hypothetical protein
MASRWMRPKLDKLRRDGLARPTNYTTPGLSLSKADARLVCQGAMVAHSKVTHCAPEPKRREYLDRNEPRLDRRTYGNFKRLDGFTSGLLKDAMVLGGPARLIARSAE